MTGTRELVIKGLEAGLMAHLQKICGVYLTSRGGEGLEPFMQGLDETIKEYERLVEAVKGQYK